MHTPSRLAGVLVLLTLAACVEIRPWRLDEPPLVAADLADVTELRLSTAAGDTLELEQARWIDDPRGARIAGRVTSPPARAGETVELAVAGLRQVETRRTETGRVLINVAIGLGIAFVAISLLAYAAASSGGFIAG